MFYFSKSKGENTPNLFKKDDATIIISLRKVNKLFALKALIKRHFFIS